MGIYRSAIFTQFHFFRGVQLPVDGVDLEAGVLVLHAHHLRPHLHARHRLLVLLLDRPQGIGML